MASRPFPFRWLLLSAVAAAGAHHVQAGADATRRALAWEVGRSFVPSPEAVRLSVLDHNTLGADLFWIRTVLLFVDIYAAQNPEDTRWLRATLETVHALDPGWRTLYHYGGGMLRVVGDIDGSDQIYQYGMETLPDESRWPFSIGMNAYMYRDDPVAASQWLDRAAALPDAPDWYRRAAASFLHRHGQRRAAIAYLEDQIRVERDEGVKKSLLDRRNHFVHDELAAALQARREAFVAREGRDIHAPAELGELPPDPLGGRWILAADGTLRSDVADRELLERAQRQEQKLLRGAWKHLRTDTR